MTSGSQAGYRTYETVFGQRTAVVGRTHDVTGTMHIVGSTVQSTRVVVNMKTVTCNCVHDVAFHNQLMETNTYPTSTFVLTRPIVLPSIPADGVVISVPVTGNFTMKGRTHEQTFQLSARRDAGRLHRRARLNPLPQRRLRNTGPERDGSLRR